MNEQDNTEQSREAWLFANPDALASVRRGIAESEAGEVSDRVRFKIRNDYWVSASWRDDLHRRHDLGEALEVAFDLVREGEAFLLHDPSIVRTGDYVQVLEMGYPGHRRRYFIGREAVHPSTEPDDKPLSSEPETGEPV